MQTSKSNHSVSFSATSSALCIEDSTVSSTYTVHKSIRSYVCVSHVSNTLINTITNLVKSGINDILITSQKHDNTIEFHDLADSKNSTIHIT